MSRSRPIAGARQPSCWVSAKALGSVVFLWACASQPARFPDRPPLWRDPDRRPFQGALAVYYSPHDWDRLDKSVFRPMSEFFRVEVSGEARNVNALDEVPDSSWFENRLGRAPLSADEMAAGACRGAELPSEGPWRIKSGKTDGATPGFVIEAPDGQRYLLKVDGRNAGPRATLADVVGSRLYHAAGFRVPCYSIVFFDRSMLELDPKAHVEDDLGRRVPLTWPAIEGVLSKASRLVDGRYRVAASRFLEGHPLGPWRYHGLREGDRNDVVPHEDRRELRASRLLAAWTDHVDQREQNTLAMWRDTAPGSGFVMHHLLDFSDCFGSVWGGSVEEARRRGYTYWFAPWDIVADFFTLGFVERPWDRARLGEQGLDFGFYAADSFDPESWVPRYPNPAFGRMTERDAAWMARILAAFDRSGIEAIVREARIDPGLERWLVRVLMDRRHRILHRYLSRLSPLANARLTVSAEQSWVCADDGAVRSGVFATLPEYRARVWNESARDWHDLPELRWQAPGELCVRLDPVSGDRHPTPEYRIVEIGSSGNEGPGPIRFHLYDEGGGRVRLAGIERRERSE